MYPSSTWRNDMTMGRPTEYRDDYADKAAKLARLGATDAEVADFFGVDVRTVYRWKNAHDDCCQALKAGKDEADARVERALYHRAVGYEQEEVKIFMPAGAEEPVYAPFTAKIAPDVTAAIFWLKNRKPDEWREKSEVANTHDVSDPIKELFAQVASAGKRIGS